MQAVTSIFRKKYSIPLIIGAAILIVGGSAVLLSGRGQGEEPEQTAPLVAAGADASAVTETSAPTKTATTTKLPSKTPTPTAEKTPTATATSTNTPTQVLTPTPTTPANPSSPTSSAPAPTVTTNLTANTEVTPDTQSDSLLPPPAPLAPEDGMVFSGASDQITLQWSAAKSVLADDEIYLISVSFKAGDQILTDYAWTRQTSWSANEYAYLPDFSDDGLFQWSVVLIRKTGTSADRVPEDDMLSQPSEEWSFVWMASDLDQTGDETSNSGGSDDDDSGDNGGGGDNSYP